MIDKSYRLEGGEIVHPASGLRLAVPPGVLGTKIRSGGDYVTYAEFAKEATGIRINAEVWAFHLASYGIQESGSGGVAVGKDIFLLRDLRSERWLGNTPFTGETKGRGPRNMGCWPAHVLHFFVGDVNGDESTDLGVVREAVTCTGYFDEEEGFDTVSIGHEISPLSWYVFRNEAGWVYAGELDEECPAAGITKLPLPGLAKDPVEFVVEMLGDHIPLNDNLTHCLEGRPGR